MNWSEKFLFFWIRVARFNFGAFEKEEFKKFLRLGVIFALIVGIYWTLRPLKDSIFMQLVDKTSLPYAKTISLLALIPIVTFYTKLLAKISRERMLTTLPAFYGIVILCFSLGVGITQAPSEIIASRTMIPFVATKIFGYFWYLFVESFGSIIFALFWAFAVDITEPDSAKRGFPLVIALGQIGGAIMPYNIGGLPYYLGLKTDTLSIIILGLLTLLIIPLVRGFLQKTSSHLLLSFQGEYQKEAAKTKQEPSFFKGLKLLLSHSYLLGIFAVNFIYDFVMTIFDFNFKIMAGSTYTGVELSRYLSLYGSSINIMSLLCLLLGISNIARFLGIGVAIASMPIIISLALFGFLTTDSLPFLFIIMVGSKAFNYSLNSPVLKQLYIPTTSNIRFKAQAWIEIFGARTAKEAGSIFNMVLNPLQSAFGAIAGKVHYLTLSGVIGFPLLMTWFLIALYLGKSFRKSINTKRFIC